MNNDHGFVGRSRSRHAGDLPVKAGIAEAFHQLFLEVASGNLEPEVFRVLNAAHPEFKLHVSMLLGQLGHSVEVV